MRATAIGDIERQVRAVVAARLGADEARIARHTSLAYDLGADSLDVVALILAIEDEFQIDVPDEDAEQISTVKQLIEYVAFAVERTQTPRARTIGARAG